MPKIIFTSQYMWDAPTAQLQNYVKYIGTRDGVDKIDESKGHPIGATGLSQLYELVLQLRGNAGARQLKKADVGLAHNLGGTAGTCLIHILKGR